MATRKAPIEVRVLPMELQVGDRLTDETAEWEIVGRPYTTNAGKDAHARVKKVGQPDVTEIWTWGAHERVTVQRAASAQGGQAMIQELKIVTAIVVIVGIVVSFLDRWYSPHALLLESSPNRPGGSRGSCGFSRRFQRFCTSCLITWNLGRHYKSPRLGLAAQR